jgi:putative membrane-bound dehydrogenase-like protein
VPPGYEVKLFAAEPDIINPVAFTIDERGRLWVVECYEYPKRTPAGRKPRDRIKVLEDTTGSGRADKVTVWAEGKTLPIGFDLATGIEVGRGGVFLGAAPYLFFLRDAEGAGRCTEQTVLLKGFGSQDTHETLNTFQWGPDSRLYGLHGIFTQSKVGQVRMNAAVWRYLPESGHFDIFAEGTSNPWGLDFDPHGQAILTACVIPHAFHIVPGGVYKRQAGASYNPYAFGYLNEICDHTHHQESGWAHAGVLVLQGDQVPPEYRGSFLMGSVHGCSVKRDVLQRRGSSFVAHHAPDFLVSGDRNFRPINLRWGPDGAIYVIDWHDQNPCHQAAPDSWDMTHGRIYKIQRTGARPAPHPDLAKQSSRELVELLKNNNPWFHRTALRLLAERQDRSVRGELENMLFQGSEETHSLRALWGLNAVSEFDEPVAARAIEHPNSWIRAWAVRLLGERGEISAAMLGRLARLAREDPALEVRSQLASTARQLSRQDPLPLLHALLAHAEDASDPNIPLLIWLAYEPHVVPRREEVLTWTKAHTAGNPLVIEWLLPRIVRRLVATGRTEDLSASLDFLGDVRDQAARRRALEALALALGDRQTTRPPNWRAVRAKLLEKRVPEIRALILRLAIVFGERGAILDEVTRARDRGQGLEVRLQAVHDLAIAHPPEGEPALLELLRGDPSMELRTEACRALASYPDTDLGRDVLLGWSEYPPALRTEAVNLLTSRKAWAARLLEAVGQKRVPRTDLTNNAILRIGAFHDSALDRQIEQVWGRVRDTPAALNALIDTMRVRLGEGPGSAERGRRVFDNHCAKCHKFEGRGHEVGPNLDGAARDIEYLLINVLDPNRVVGKPYFTQYVVLKDGRVETGLLAAEEDRTITLKNENDALKVIARNDIESIPEQPKSLMPEGLANNMTVGDFRDLVRYVMANPFLTDVEIAGPLPRDAADPGRKSKWRRPVVGVSGRIPLPATSGSEPQVAWVRARVEAPEVVKTRMLLGSRNAVVVRIDADQLIYSGTPGKDNVPDQTAAEVALRKGVNEILLRVTYRGDHEGVYARLLDPAKKLGF